MAIQKDLDKEEDIWEMFERILSEYPDDVFDDLPKDLAENHDKYLYDQYTRKRKDD